MLDSQSLAQGFSKIYERYTFFRNALLHLDPLLQMELRIYSKPDNGLAWVAQPTMKASVMQNVCGLYRPQSEENVPLTK